MDFLLISVIFFLLAAVQAILVARFGMRGFSYRRGFSRAAASEGERVEFIEVIGNRSPLFLPWVRVETRIPPSFAFSTREEVEIRGGNYHKSVFTLTPFSRSIPKISRVKVGCGPSSKVSAIRRSTAAQE